MTGPEYKALRLSKGYTAQALADRLGVSRSCIMRREVKGCSNEIASVLMGLHIAIRQNVD